MTAAVQMPIVVEVDEVYQGLATGLAGKASSVPATLLSCPGCKHSVFPWPHLLPALPGRGAGWSKAAPPSQCFSWLFHPNHNLFSPYLWAKPTSTAGSTKNPRTWFPFFLKFVKLSIPKLPFPTRVPEASSCRSESAKGGGRGVLKGVVLHTFSQVHSPSLGGTRRATPCPRASRLRWAQKSRSSASSSSPTARQYRSYRNRPPL